MSALAYASATVYLAAAIVRHVADGLTLAAEAICPPWNATFTFGTPRRTWCEECHDWHVEQTVYVHTGDPTDAREVGVHTTCPADEDEDA